MQVINGSPSPRLNDSRSKVSTSPHLANEATLLPASLQPMRTKRKSAHDTSVSRDPKPTRGSNAAQRRISQCSAIPSTPMLDRDERALRPTPQPCSPLNGVSHHPAMTHDCADLGGSAAGLAASPPHGSDTPLLSEARAPSPLVTHTLIDCSTKQQTRMPALHYAATP